MIFPAQTSRLVLRAWREDDFDAFAAMNADPRVMEYFPAPLTREESAAFFGHIREEFQTEGFGLYAVERISDGSQLGYTGLHRVTFDGLCGQIEVIWRLRADAWGNGYAPEAAQACLTLAAKLGIEEIIAFTAVANLRSQRVMQKIGMECVAQFNHPTLPEGHPLRLLMPATTTPANHRVCGDCCHSGQRGTRPPPEVLPAGKWLPPFRCTHSFRSARFRDAHAAGIISARNRRFRGCRPTRRRHKR